MTIQPHWRTFLLGWAILLAGSLLAHFVQTSNDVTIEDIRFTDNAGNTLSALLYIPTNATPQTPAPGILAVHGYINSREVQSGFAIEFARRGYVVLALDQAGHGYSDAPAFANGFGGPAALSYLRSLDVVDPENIGLEGHSMGGWTVLAAAAAAPDDYKSIVLQGSSTGSGMSAPGTAQWPRNVSVVFAKYDEFAPLMWEVARAQDVSGSGKLQTLFGTDAPVVAGQVYGDIWAGTARVLQTPSVTHPGNHLSHASIGHALDWFALTLDGGDPRAVSGQIWFFKEIGTLSALIGFVILITGSIRLLLSLPWFNQLANAPQQFAYTQRNGRWWLAALISAIVPVLTFYPFMGWGAQWLPASAWFPQSIGNQIIVWALLNGFILTALSLALRTPRSGVQHKIVPSVVLAVVSISVAYFSVVLADYFFKIDFRFWFVGVKALSFAQFQIMLAYMLPFTVFFVLTLRALHSGLSVAGDSSTHQYVSNALAMMGGFLVFLLLQYGSLFTRGLLLTPAEPLNTIVMIQFVPLLLIVAIISTCAYRLTASYLPGALINALFVSWYIAAGQATQFAVN